MPSRWDTVSVDGEPMRCYVNIPDAVGPFPAVVVIQHAGGVDDFVRGMSDRLAGAHFAAIAPDLYHRDDPNSSDDPLTRMGRLRDVTIVAMLTLRSSTSKGFQKWRQTASALRDIAWAAASPISWLRRTET